MLSYGTDQEAVLPLAFISTIHVVFVFVDQISCLILHAFPTLTVFNSEIILYYSLWEVY